MRVILLDKSSLSACVLAKGVVIVTFLQEVTSISQDLRLDLQDIREG